jgi:spermidine synthase
MAVSARRADPTPLAGPSESGGTLTEALTDGFGYTLRFRKCLLDRRTRFQHLQIFDTEEFGHVLRLDGALQCSERDEFFYHEPLVHMAAFSHPWPTRALVIGGGDGGSAEELLKHASIAEVVLVEIDDQVIQAARQFLASVNGGLFDAPSARFAYVNADGGAYLHAHTADDSGRFDLIVLDLTDAGGASAPLYQRGFYRQCLARLRKGGVMTLHIASPWAHPQRVRATIGELVAAGWRVDPFMTSVPMSGGSWLMGLCRPADVVPVGLPPMHRRALTGQPLKFYSPEMHRAMLTLPPYVRHALGR